MSRPFAIVSAAFALLLAPAAARAACDHNPPKATMVDGKRVKCAGPFMMHAEDISDGYYDCKVAGKGTPVKALYKDCAQVNKGGPSKPPAKKSSKKNSAPRG